MSAGDDPIAWYEGSDLSSSTRRYLYADRLGSITNVVSNSGASIAINTFDEYGIPGSGNEGRFQYTGQAFLEGIGLYHYKARMYSPSLGRFMQTDPIGYADGMNWYNYVGGDPVNGVDPDGTRIVVIGYKPGKGHFRAILSSWEASQELVQRLTDQGYRDVESAIYVEAQKKRLSPRRAATPQKPQYDGTDYDIACSDLLSEPGRIEFGASSVQIIVGGGITGSIGEWRNTSTGSHGRFFTLGGGGGVDVGVDVVQLGSFDSLADFAGFGANLQGGIGIVSAGVTFNKNLDWVGINGGLGLSWPGITGTGTLTGTKLYGCKTHTPQ